MAIGGYTAVGCFVKKFSRRYAMYLCIGVAVVMIVLYFEVDVERVAPVWHVVVVVSQQHVLCRGQFVELNLEFSLGRACITRSPPA